MTDLRARRRTFTWRFPDAAAFVDTFRRWNGPTLRAFAAVGEAGAPALEADLVALVERSARRRDGAIAVPAEYLEVVAVRR